MPEENIKFKNELIKLRENMEKISELTIDEFDYIKLKNLLKDITENLENLSKFSRNEKIATYGAISILFFILIGILTAIIVPTLKSKHNKKNKI